MSLSAIRGEIVKLLKGVTGIGIVHDYERWTADWKRYLALFAPKGQEVINGWTVTRTSSDEEPHAENQHYRFHRMVIRGYYSHKDDAASERTFQDLVERVCDSLRVNRSLNGVAEHAEPPQVTVVEPRAFGDVLCHYAEIHLTVEEDVTF